MNKIKFFLKGFIGMATSAVIGLNTLTCTAFAGQKADKVIEYAETLIGISGRPNIITQYWNLTTEWCAQTIVYVGDKTGVSYCFPRVTFVDRSGNYTGFRDWFEGNGRFFYRDYYTPMKGDLIIFDYNRDNKGDHIGFVSAVNSFAKLVYTIEGNANDMVAAKTYEMSNPNILGYCRPYYNDEEEAAPVVTTAVNTDVTIQTTTATTSAYEQPVQTMPVIMPSLNNGVTAGETYYVSSSIGCNLRSKPNYSDSNIIEILDTNTALTVQSVENGFAYCQINNTGKWGYVHTSTIAKTGQNTYSYGCAANHYVSSEIGCNLRSEPNLSDSSVKCILDTNTNVTVLSKGKDFSYCEVVLYNENVLNGYIHNSSLSPIGTSSHNTNQSASNGINGENYYVSSEIGCKLRSSAAYDESNVVSILDTYTPVKVLSYENGFAYCEVKLNNGVIYGYVHTSVIAK
ncbi:MAG: CHAP domain-containing protein [Ruminococcus sp.]|nr:CHAP domain-containing protein [Ruminococcus sp.]